MISHYWIQRALLLLAAYLFYLWSWNSAFGEAPQNLAITLKGHLGKEELQAATAKIDALASGQQLVIILNSNSGELVQSLELAKKIYGLKSAKKIPVIVYIDDNAVGPAAIFPFLADELYISNFISWGDIPLGNEKVYSTNVLRSRVVSLIDLKRPHTTVLQLLASAMSDPSIHIIDNKGWRQAKGDEDTVSSKGETLVINHHQVETLALAKKVVSPEQFAALYPGVSDLAPLSTVLPTLEGQAMPKKLLMEELQKHVAFNASGPNTIGLISVVGHDTSISQATWLYVKKALDYYKQTKPVLIVLELNTPGGEVFAAQLISDALKEMDTQHNIPIVAYINNWAISAGAMLAYSSRFIVVAKDASMGAAEPVMAGAEGTMEQASEKVNSAIRTDFSNRARFFDRDPLIAEAMVDKDLILVIRHGRLTKLDNETQIKTVGTDPDVLLSPKGKLLTLDAEKMLQLGVADMLIPPKKIEPLTEAEKESGKWPASKSALFHQPFFSSIPQATIDAYQMDLKMQFFAFLASPWVSSLLMLGLMVGFYMELTNPGFGLPGTIAVTCLFLIVLSSYSLEIANWLELILLIVGLSIILVELFVLPTFGLLGFIGVIFFIMGLFGMMLPGIHAVDFEFDTNTLNAAGQAFFERLAWLCGTLVVAFLIIAILARFVTPKFANFTRLVLHGNEQNGYVSVENLASLPKPGSRGDAATTLRPAGKVTINDTLYDAVSGGSLIEKGDPIIVTGIDSGTLVVMSAKNSGETSK